jgi:hypothetical protein
VSSLRACCLPDLVAMPLTHTDAHTHIHTHTSPPSPHPPPLAPTRTSYKCCLRPRMYLICGLPRNSVTLLCNCFLCISFEQSPVLCVHRKRRRWKSGEQGQPKVPSTIDGATESPAARTVKTQKTMTRKMRSIKTRTRTRISTPTTCGAETCTCADTTVASAGCVALYAFSRSARCAVCRTRGVVDGADFAGECPEVVVAVIPPPPVMSQPRGDGSDPNGPAYKGDPEFHFAPASVHHLLETKLFEQLVATAIGRGNPAIASAVGVTSLDIEAVAEFYHNTGNVTTGSC